MFTGMKDDPKMGEAEKRKLKEVVTEVEKAVEKAEDLVIENFEDGNDLKEKIVEKYGNIFGVENVYIYDPSNPPLDKSGNPINANGVNVDGIIYLNQNFVNTGDMKKINRVVGEEAGEIKAIKGGMWNQTTQDGTPAVETIGRIIGQAVESESTNKINDAGVISDSVDWNEVGSVDGADMILFSVNASIGALLEGGGGLSGGVIVNDETGKVHLMTGFGLGTASKWGAGGSIGSEITYFPNVNSPNDIGDEGMFITTISAKTEGVQFGGEIGIIVPIKNGKLNFEKMGFSGGISGGLGISSPIEVNIGMTGGVTDDGVIGNLPESMNVLLEKHRKNKEAIYNDLFKKIDRKSIENKYREVKK